VGEVVFEKGKGILNVASVRELAERIDERLGDLAFEKGQKAACEAALAIAEVAVRRAEERLLEARVALFEEYPELLGEESLASVRARAAGDGRPEYESVQVDDPDRPPWIGSWDEAYLDNMWESHDGG
jgi:hypothetical protein